MKYNTPAAVLAGALLALGVATTAQATTTPPTTHDTDAPTHKVTRNTPAHHPTPHKAGRILGTTDTLTDALRHPRLSRDKGSLIDNGPRSTGMRLANLPLRVSTPD